MAKFGNISVEMCSKGRNGGVFQHVVRGLFSLINFKKKLRKADKIILFAFCFAAFGLLISVMLPCNSSHIGLQLILENEEKSKLVQTD